MIPDPILDLGDEYCVPRVGGGDPMGLFGFGAKKECSPRRRG